VGHEWKTLQQIALEVSREWAAQGRHSIADDPELEREFFEEIDRRFRAQQADEIGDLLASDPNANVVEGKPQAWLLTGTALEVAREAIGKSEPNRG